MWQNKLEKKNRARQEAYIVGVIGKKWDEKNLVWMQVMSIKGNKKNCGRRATPEKKKLNDQWKRKRKRESITREWNRKKKKKRGSIEKKWKEVEREGEGERNKRMMFI